jgi:hypothetical protein
MLNPVCLSPEKVDKIVKAACALHNMLRTMAPDKYVPLEDEQAKSQNRIPSAVVAGRRSATKSGKEIREELTDYFCSEEGALAWQQGQI